MPKKLKKNSHMTLFILVLAIVCAVLGGIFLTKNQSNTTRIESSEQFAHSDRTRWSTDYIFGEEDREMFPVINEPNYIRAEEAGALF